MSKIENRIAYPKNLFFFKKFFKLKNNIYYAALSWNLIYIAIKN